MFPSNAAQRYVTANLNMRNGNSSRNKIVTVIPKGTMVLPIFRQVLILD